MDEWYTFCPPDHTHVIRDTDGCTYVTGPPINNGRLLLNDGNILAVPGLEHYHELFGFNPNTEPPTDSPTEVSTEAPTEIPTEAPTEAPTEVLKSGPTTGYESLYGVDFVMAAAPHQHSWNIEGYTHVEVYSTPDYLPKNQGDFRYPENHEFGSNAEAFKPASDWEQTYYPESHTHIIQDVNGLTHWSGPAQNCGLLSTADGNYPIAGIEHYHYIL